MSNFSQTTVEQFKRLALLIVPKAGIIFSGAILCLFGKLKLPILLYILQYEFRLCDHTKGFSRVTWVLRLNKVNLASWTEICLSWCVSVMEIETMVDNEGIGHRLVRKKGIFKIAEFYLSKSDKNIQIFRFYKRAFPDVPHTPWGFLSQFYDKNCNISKIWRYVFEYLVTIQIWSFSPLAISRLKTSNLNCDQILKNVAPDFTYIAIFTIKFT